MTAIERTAYPGFSRAPQPKELIDLYTLTPADMAFVSITARGPKRQIEDILEKVEQKPEGKQTPRVLDAQRVESFLRQITHPGDHALFWLIYDGGLRCQEALAIDIEDISWPDRSILIQGKGDQPRAMFFSCAVGTLLDKYLTARGVPTSGPLFVTQRKARFPRRANLAPDGYARLSYRKADTLWKAYTPKRDIHQLRHTAISVRAVPTTSKWISSVLVGTLPCAAWNAISPTTAKQPSGKRAWERRQR